MPASQAASSVAAACASGDDLEQIAETGAAETELRDLDRSQAEAAAGERVHGFAPLCRGMAPACFGRAPVAAGCARCRLFQLSGAEVRRNPGRTGGFKEGEFEADGATKEVATQICLSRPDAAGRSSRAARLSAKLPGSSPAHGSRRPRPSEMTACIAYEPGVL